MVVESNLNLVITERTKMAGRTRQAPRHEVGIPTFHHCLYIPVIVVLLAFITVINMSYWECHYCD